MKLRTLLTEDRNQEWYKETYDLMNQLFWDTNDILNKAKKDRSIHRPDNDKNRVYDLVKKMNTLANDYIKGTKQKLGTKEPREPRSWDMEPGD